MTDVIGGAFAATWAIGLHKQLQQQDWQVRVKDPNTGAPFQVKISEDNRSLKHWKLSSSGCGAVLARVTGHKDKKSYRINLDVEKLHDPSAPSFSRLGRFRHTNASKTALDKNGNKNSEDQTHFELVSDFYSCLDHYSSTTSATPYAETKSQTGLAPEECVVAIFKLVEERNPLMPSVRTLCALNFWLTRCRC